jgi:hypothetical protein
VTDLRAPPGSPPVPTLLLRAKDTGIEGETLRVTLGESITCGRSRRCHWSLKRTVPYLEDRNGARERLEAAIAFRSVSRRHCRISFLALDLVEVENLSSNGTLVDGHAVDRLMLTDCRTRAHVLQLGPEGLELELSPGSLPV